MTKPHHHLCIQFVNAIPDTNRICVCDLIEQIKEDDRRIVREQITEHMRRLALATEATTDDAVNSGVINTLVAVMDKMSPSADANA